jgi:phosphohistidine swiveling domain-containing protein
MSVLELKDVTNVNNFGGKAANLAKLLQAGLPVPVGFAVGIDAFDIDGKLKNNDRIAIEAQLKDRLYAVRSSALAEDADDESWAGQFETFLNTMQTDVIQKIEQTHNSVKLRAKAYASDNNVLFQVAVVVQEMIKAEYAGVLFTNDPVTGAKTPVTEYIEGLGEELVSGRADPIRINLNDKSNAPFDIQKLKELATTVEKLFGKPQDIEWAWANNKMWLVQARPITTTQQIRTSYYLGEPDDLFYWGPSRAKPHYMSDFMAAAERFFKWAAKEPNMPNPPRTVVLFHKGKMVWLSNARSFTDFVEKVFDVYEKRNLLANDIANWKSTSYKLEQLNNGALNTALVDAWYYAEFAEFSLYGAEAALAKRLSRFDDGARHEIWSAFTVPDKPTFLNRIDVELALTKDIKAMASKYSWLEDGYDGLSGSVENYFEKRLKIVEGIEALKIDSTEKRTNLTRKYSLTEHELSALNLARQLAEFMDDRKAWMMQTRRLLKKPVGNIKFGWFFDNGEAKLINKYDTEDLWERYVDFKASNSTVSGIVASNGGRHFIHGNVIIVNSPSDTVEEGKIIVVSSTSPSYVPLMRKAKALITDHGGMMSHAAIVAREFNLPCIVGTKKATKVLCDGETVVLDLIKGEIISQGSTIARKSKLTDYPL